MNAIFGASVFFDPVVFTGSIIGMLFGAFLSAARVVSPTAATALVLPLTFGQRPIAAIITLASVAFGALAGRTAAAVHAGDAGQGKHLTRTLLALATAAALAILFDLALAPAIEGVVLQFGPSEISALMSLFLLAAAMLSIGSPLRGFAMVFLGLLLGVVGSDINTGLSRLTFGQKALDDGVSLVAMAIGLFAVADVIATLAGDAQPRTAPFKPRRAVAGGLFGAMGSGLLRGLFPFNGAGLTTSPEDQHQFPDPADPGNHADADGMTAAAAAGGARLSASFLPSLVLGVPTNALAAILLAGMMIQGIVPGPALAAQHPDIFFGVIGSALVIQCLLVVTVIPLGGLLHSLAGMDRRVVAAVILAACFFGVYSANADALEIVVMIIAGVIGYLFIRSDCERGLLLIAFVLGPRLEENIRRAMLIASGDWLRIVERPIVSTMITVAVALLLMLYVLRRRRAAS